MLIAYRRLQLLAGPKYGISWIMNYAPTDNEAAGRGGFGGATGNPLMPESITNPRLVLQPGEHPFPTKYAIERTEMRIEPSIYLDALMTDFLLWGGKVVIRKFETPADVAALGENVIINCTGLGSKALFNDPELMPLKGQLTVLMPQSEITYATSGGARAPVTPDAGFVHMMPRTRRHRARRHVDSRRLVARSERKRASTHRREPHRFVQPDAHDEDVGSGRRFRTKVPHEGSSRGFQP